MKAIVTDKSVEVNYIVQYLEDEKDVERLENGDWTIWYNNPWEAYTERKFDSLTYAVEFFLINRTKYYDMSLLLEVCKDGICLLWDSISDLPSINSLVSNQIKRNKDDEWRLINQTKREFEALEKLKPILELPPKDMEQIMNFTNQRLGRAE